MGNNLGKDAYEIIKEMIIKGDLKPGESLEEKKLMSYTNASRTPIREALIKLSLEKFVMKKGRKGYIVASMDLSTINSIFQTRIYFEPETLEMFRGMEFDEELLNFLKKFQCYLKLYEEEKLNPKKKDEMNELDSEFHDFLISQSKNVFTIDTIKLVKEHHRRFRLHIRRQDTCTRIEDAIKEHIEIAKLLLDKNINEAKKVLSKHLANSKLDYLISIGSF
jgi:DNA-binding GntR family transcriptional regulator